MRLLLICVFFTCLTNQSFGQDKYLVLENVQKFTREIFRPGDEITFRTHDSKANFSGRILSVDDSVLVIVKVIQMQNDGDGTNNVYKDYIPLREIASVYFVKDSYWQFFRGFYSVGATAGGVFLMGVTGLNRITDSNKPPIDKKAFWTAAGLAVSGVLIWLLGGKKYKKLDKKWRLRAMESFDPRVISEGDEGMRK